MNMQVSNVETFKIDAEIYFVLWVGRADMFGMRDRPYLFKWEGSQVFFMYGGRLVTPRLIGVVYDQDHARAQAAQWLERCLRQRGELN